MPTLLGPPRYTAAAIALHWLPALTIVSSLAVGRCMSNLPLSPTRLRLINWHKWAGVLILGLSALRLLWRLTHRPPVDRTLAARLKSLHQALAAGSEIPFTTRQMSVPVKGRLAKFSAQVLVDPRKPESGSVGLGIDTGSARFGAPELDGEWPKPTWLNAGKFPQATFESSAIKATGPGRFEVSGKLTIKGSVRELLLPVQLAQAAGHSKATGSFVIKRLDFKVGEAEWADTSLLANDVTVKFKRALAGLAPL